MLTETTHPLAASAAKQATVVVRQADLRLRITLREQPRCIIQVQGLRSVALGPGDPLLSTGAGANAYATLAADLADRAVDALLMEPACQ